MFLLQYLIRPARAAEAVTFCLDTKSNQKNQAKKSFNPPCPFLTLVRLQPEPAKRAFPPYASVGVLRTGPLFWQAFALIKPQYYVIPVFFGGTRRDTRNDGLELSLLRCASYTSPYCS